jgi:hypothetical protein
MWNLHSLGVTVLITLALSAGSAWFGYSKGKQAGTTAVQTLWNSEKATLAEAVIREVNLAQAREKELQDKLAQAQRSRREAINRIAALERDLADSLRNRPEARAGAGGVPETPTSGTGCTGEGLARPDAGFLARYSADAARLQAALDACKAGYRALGGTVID